MLVIASAGCNVLHYLTHRPAAITAVDLNPHHLHLTRLKLAAAAGLPDHESFFRFFGYGGHDQGVALYRRHVRPLLAAETRQYWDGGGQLRKKVFGERVKIFRRNFYNHARLGWFLRAAHAFGRINGQDLKNGLRCRTREEQQRFFDEMVDPVLNHWALRTLSKFPAALFCLGIPPQQSAELQSDQDEGRTLLEIYRERLRRLACDHDASENYFFWQAFGRQYDCERRLAVPCYLKAEHFQTLRQGAGAVRTEFASLQGYLRQQQDDTLNRFVFLDAQDWMQPEGIAELWAEIARTGQPGTRIIFRTAGQQSPVQSALPGDLRARFRYEAEEARELHARDRSSIYGAFHLYVLDPDA